MILHWIRLNKSLSKQRAAPEVSQEPEALMEPTGRPGLDPESGVKNPPWTRPEVRKH